MRSRIFAEKNIKYKEAVELALALEAAEKHAEVSAATTAMASTSASGLGGEVSEGLHRASAQRAGARGGSGGGAAACWRCGKQHRSDRCRFAQYNCDQCGQRGHLKVMCKKVFSEVRSGLRTGARSCGRPNLVNQVDTEEDEDFYNIKLSAKGTTPYFIIINVDGHRLECEVDTGSRISAISADFYKRYFSNKSLNVDNLILRCYSGSRIESLGYIYVEVQLGETRAKNLQLYVIKNGGRPLLGRAWMHALNIRQINFNEIVDDAFTSQLLTEFPEVFSDKLGTCKKTIQLELTDKEPVYVRARPVPLALRARRARAHTSRARGHYLSRRSF
ncbi:unnamed protein product [Parnassius mnemosyne]|uniref:Uncharacterized protein n=1 Tax=Parnassius mnemosyne TaxID=213953 RepID=A0AAV1M649_9NEOP